jgi:hypothetical protein
MTAHDDISQLSEKARRNVRATIAAAKKMVSLDLSERTGVCDFASDTVLSVSMNGTIFRGQFPKLRVLYMRNIVELDVSQSPNIQRVMVRKLTVDLCNRILDAIPRIGTIPLSHTKSAVDTAQMHRLLSERAPHLLPQLNRSASWTPQIHNAFDNTERHTMTLFIACMERLSDTGAVSKYDPAMFEEVLRCATLCPKWYDMPEAPEESDESDEDSD